MAITIEKLQKCFPEWAWTPYTVENWAGYHEVMPGTAEWIGALHLFNLNVSDKTKHRDLVVITLKADNTFLTSGYGTTLGKAIKKLQGQKTFKDLVQAVESLKCPPR